MDPVENGSYSFICSPIERYWSAFKSGVKAAFLERSAELLEPLVPGGESLTCRLSRILSEVAIEPSMQHAEIHNLQEYSILAQASNGEDVKKV